MYTVPYEVEAVVERTAEWEKEAVGAVECVIVENDKVVDTGSLSKFIRKEIVHGA